MGSVSIKIDTITFMKYAVMAATEHEDSVKAQQSDAP